MRLQVPTHLKTWEELMAFAWRVQEKLRLEFNATGAAYKADVESLVGAPWPKNLRLPQFLDQEKADSDVREQTLALEAEFERYRDEYAQPRELATAKAINAAKDGARQADLSGINPKTLFVEDGGADV